MKVFSAIFCLFFIFKPLFAEKPHGRELYRESEKLLTSEGCIISYEPLVQNVQNDFPTNLVVRFPSKKTEQNDKYDGHNLIIAFTMEEANENKELISNIIQIIKNTSLPYSVELLLSYGDLQKIQTESSVFGTNVFATNIQEPDLYTALCLNFTKQERARIIPGGKGDIAPLWLTKSLSESLSKKTVPYIMRGGTVNALFKFGIIPFDERTSSFLQQSIPAISLSIPINYDADLYSSCIEDFLINFENAKKNDWNRHYIIFNISEKTFFIDERTMIFVFIFISLISFFLISGQLITIKKQKNYARLLFKHLLPVLFLSLLAILLSLFIGQGISFLFDKFATLTIFSLLIIKIIASFVMASVLYTSFLLPRKFLKARLLSNIGITISTLNIIIFSSIDLSFIFLFALEFIIVYISKFTKKTSILSVLLFLMIITFVPYIIQTIGYGNVHSFRKIVFADIYTNAALSLLFLPIYILWLRISYHQYKKWGERLVSKGRIRIRILIIIFAGTLLFTILLVFSIRFIPSTIIPDSLTRNVNQVQIQEQNDSVISCHIRDRKSFDSVLRVLTIQLGEEAEYCSISISGKDINPIIYSDSEYYSDLQNKKDIFLIPECPSKTLIFSYTTSQKQNETISISAWYPNEKFYIKRNFSTTIKENMD